MKSKSGLQGGGGIVAIKERRDFELCRVVEAGVFEMLLSEQSLEDSAVCGKVVLAEGSASAGALRLEPPRCV